MRCPTCEKMLPTRQGMRQHHTKVHDDPLPNRLCEECDQRFYDAECSRRYCYDCIPPQSVSRDRGNTETDCLACGTMFRYYPSEKPGHYCPDCIAADHVVCMPPDAATDGCVRVTCSYCGDPFEVYRYKTNQDVLFCGRDCYARWLSATLRADVDSPDHYGAGWRPSKRRALDRDDHTCQRCGATAESLGQNPDVHHITPVRTFDDPTDAHTLDNLVCLCRACHMAVEWGDAEVPQE